jgi:hypothetical protein
MNVDTTEADECGPSLRRIEYNGRTAAIDSFRSQE